MSNDKDYIYISQIIPKVCGLGHQVHGIMTLMSFHDISNVKYSPFVHNNNITHIHKSLIKDLAGFITDINNNFKEKYNTNHNNRVRSGLNRPNFNLHYQLHYKEKSTKIYCFNDALPTKNCYQFVKDFDYKDIIINSKFLPKPNFKENSHNVVIHIRGHDAMYKRVSSYKNELYLKQINNSIKKILELEDNVCFYLHTDITDDQLEELFKKHITCDYIIVNNNDKENNKDYLNNKEIEDVEKQNFFVFKKQTHVLFAFSQMIHCDTLIVGDSLLSVAAMLLKEKKRTLLPDQIDCLACPSTKKEYKKYGIVSFIDNCMSFSKFLS